MTVFVQINVIYTRQRHNSTGNVGVKYYIIIISSSITSIIIIIITINIIIMVVIRRLALLFCLCKMTLVFIQSFINFRADEFH